jgi:ATP-dependent DNA ligase
MPAVRAHFIEPMLLQLTTRLPEGAQWLYELKLDGYRAIAYKAGGKVRRRSRNDKDLTTRHPGIASALSALPDDTVIDGEVVAIDESGEPSFNLLHNFGSSKDSLLYYVFDVPILAGRDLMNEPLSLRRELLPAGLSNAVPVFFMRRILKTTCRNSSPHLVSSKTPVCIAKA